MRWFNRRRNDWKRLSIPTFKGNGDRWGRRLLLTLGAVIVACAIVMAATRGWQGFTSSEWPNPAFSLLWRGLHRFTLWITNFFLLIFSPAGLYVTLLVAGVSLGFSKKFRSGARRLWERIQAGRARRQSEPIKLGSSDIIPPDSSHDGNGEHREENQGVGPWLGWFLFGGLALLGLLFLPWQPRLGLIILAVDLIYFGTNLHQIADPEFGILFQMGRLITALNSGWYLTIPHFWSIKLISTSSRRVEIDEQMYTNEKTPIRARARFYFRVKKESLKTNEDLLNLLRLMPEEMSSRAHAICNSQLKGCVGSKTFSALLTDRVEIEQSVKGGIEKTADFQKYGYELLDFEVYDFEETTESEARRIRVLGEAQGQAAKSRAEAIAGAVRDNYPAALLGSVEAVVDGAKEVAKEWRKEKRAASKEEKKEEKPAQEGIVGALLGKLTGR